MVENAIRRPEVPYPRFRSATPSWDNTARRTTGATIMRGSDPALYRRWLAALVDRAGRRPEEDRLVFINAWNEWAEGNHLEPDQRHGRAYLEATRDALRHPGGYSMPSGGDRP